MPQAIPALPLHAGRPLPAQCGVSYSYGPARAGALPRRPPRPSHSTLIATALGRAEGTLPWWFPLIKRPATAAYSYGVDTTPTAVQGTHGSSTQQQSSSPETAPPTTRITTTVATRTATRSSTGSSASASASASARTRSSPCGSCKALLASSGSGSAVQLAGG